MSNKNGLFKNAYRGILNISAKAIGVKRTKELDARIRFGRRLDLDHPTTLADKVSWVELNTDQSIATRLTDKYGVRDFVAQRGLGDILVPLCGGPWNNASEIDFDELPDSFVIKATHGCGMNLLVDDKSGLDIPATRKKMNKWLSEDYPRACIEPHYQNVPRRLYAEEMLKYSNNIVDYKFHCIDGDPKFVLVCSNREESINLSLFDVRWNPLTEHLQNTRITNPLPKSPAALPQMVAAARRLSQGFPFVRVDLYASENKVFFGEMTFSPAAGVFNHFDDAFIRKWGKELDLGKYGS
ncbi:ATP-grasp fold amidoligase family protein [Bifidobacterium pseudolongum]|uniref:ATP-grasp fold amidoligase family protein n=1 Tax=Bifidobacterium pseudolongum TaxID=1694 RepID=UPI001F5965A6|nr:ATP-grasp fold amidoligase family protein [Bifidobacterium pseudolongum]